MIKEKHGTKRKPLDAEEVPGYSVRNTLYSGVIALQRARIETASLDARVLLQFVLGIDREQLLADDQRLLDPAQYAAYQALIERRVLRQPVSQLIGKREFWGLTFKVTEDTLDPRPDSETLIEAVLGRCRDRNGAYKILDLGTGTGCLALTLLTEYPHATATGMDISDKALAVAQANAASLGLQERAEFIRGGWNDELKGSFDILISNPPYIPTDALVHLAPEVKDYEPVLALDGGIDGMDCYRALVPQLPQLLAPAGIAVLEIGMGQQHGVSHIAAGFGLQVAAIKEDMAGIPRCIVITNS